MLTRWIAAVPHARAAHSTRWGVSIRSKDIGGYCCTWYIAMAIDSCRFFQQTSSVLGCANRICCAFSDCSPTGPEERTLGEDARTVSTVFFLVSGGFLTKKSFVGANWLLQFWGTNGVLQDWMKPSMMSYWKSLLVETWQELASMNCEMFWILRGWIMLDISCVSLFTCTVLHDKYNIYI